MPAKSQAQQKFMGMVHAAQKKGGKAASPEVAKTAKSIKKKDAKAFASTKHKGLPKKVTEGKDETNVANAKPIPQRWRGHKNAWDARIHSKGSYWKLPKHATKTENWGARAKSGQIDYFWDPADAQKFANYTHKGGPSSYVAGNFMKGKTEGLREAKDETSIQRKKGRLPRGYDRASWEWRIHSKGSYWQSGKDFGARAKTGEVDYFPYKRTAIRFADWTNPDTKPGSYVRGAFAKKGTSEGVQKVREYVRGMVREALIERRRARKEAYDPAAEGERASKLDALAAKHGIKMRQGESRDEFEDRVSAALSK